MLNHFYAANSRFLPSAHFASKGVHLKKRNLTAQAAKAQWQAVISEYKKRLGFDMRRSDTDFDKRFKALVVPSLEDFTTLAAYQPQKEQGVQALISKIINILLSPSKFEITPNTTLTTKESNAFRKNFEICLNAWADSLHEATQNQRAQLATVSV